MLHQTLPAGAQQAPQGHALGVEMVRRFGLKKGDVVIVIGDFDASLRAEREEGTAKALEEAGVKVVRLSSRTEWAADPNLAIPVVTAALQANPNAKAIVYPGGQQLGNAATYMKLTSSRLSTGFCAVVVPACGTSPIQAE
ncbi:MAG TPA: hypothetical protein VJY34_01730 [Roseiarcus sp.]|nr:hypothetical protein [Roseiarcus sp.]